MNHKIERAPFLANTLEYASDLAGHGYVHWHQYFGVECLG